MKTKIAIFLIVSNFSHAKLNNEVSLTNFLNKYLAKSNNIDVANNKVEQASEEHNKTNGSFLPTATFNAQTTKTDTLDSSSQSSTTNYLHTLSYFKVTQNIFNGFKDISTKDLKKINLEKAKKDLSNEKFNQIITGMNYYFNFLKADQKVKDISVEISNNEKSLSEMKRNQRAGMARVSQVKSLETTLASNKIDLLTAQKDLEVVKQSVKIFLGEDFDISNEVLLDDKNAQIADSDLLIENRPDYKGQLDSEQMAEKQLTAVKSVKLPTLDLSGSYYLTDNAKSSSQKDYYTVGLYLTVPFPFGPEKNSTVNSAVLDVTNAKIATKVKFDTLAVEKKTLINEYNATVDIVIALKDAVKTSEENVSALKRDYASGLSSYTDYLSASMSLEQTKSNYHQQMIQLEFLKYKVKFWSGNLDL